MDLPAEHGSGADTWVTGCLLYSPIRHGCQ